MFLFFFFSKVRQEKIFEIEDQNKIIILILIIILIINTENSN